MVLLLLSIVALSLVIMHLWYRLGQPNTVQDVALCFIPFAAERFSELRLNKTTSNGRWIATNPASYFLTYLQVIMFNCCKDDLTPACSHSANQGKMQASIFSSAVRSYYNSQ